MFYSRLRLIAFFPYYVQQWYRIRSLRDEERWDEVAALLEKMHRRVNPSGNSRYWLGTALLHEHRWREALDEFEKITKPLSDDNNERSRFLNQALALYQVGQRQEASRLLKQKVDDRWEGSQLEKAKTLIARIETEH